MDQLNFKQSDEFNFTSPFQHCEVYQFLPSFQEKLDNLRITLFRNFFSNVRLYFSIRE